MARPRTKPRSGLGLLIQTLREKRHWTIAELCQRSGLSRSTIEKAEAAAGATRKAATCDKIAQALGIGDSQKLFELWREDENLQTVLLTIRADTYERAKTRAEAAKLSVEKYLSNVVDEIMTTKTG